MLSDEAAAESLTLGAVLRELGNNSQPLAPAPPDGGPASQ